MKGIDVSENNGEVDFQAVKNAGYDFVIVRLGYGNCHLDSNFYRNVNGALDAGLKIGVYYYDYGLDVIDAQNQAAFTLMVLLDCGLKPERLEMGVWYDMEDADSWKHKHGMPNSATLTNMCSAFVEKCRAYGYDCGVYSCLDWLENKIVVNRLPADTKLWCAQYNRSCDYSGAYMWQYTASANINGRYFDANVLL